VASQTEENYLKALFTLKHIHGEISVSELGKRLDVSTPTVNSMIKKLHAKGLVHYEKYRPVKLSEKGERIAALIIRKHRLSEMFLVEKMGFGWEEVHEIAEQMEHIKAPEFFDKMDALLGFPKADPHGSPIPDKDGNIHRKSFRKLSSCAPGETVRLAAVVEASDDFLRFLNSRNLQLDLAIEVLSKEPFDGSMVVRYGDRKREVLSGLVCERLLIEE